MHKKSIEAASKMKEEEDDEEPKHDVKDDVKSESIAALRARAQQHSSKMMQVLHKDDCADRIDSGTNRVNYDNTYITERLETMRHVTH